MERGAGGRRVGGGTRIAAIRRQTVASDREEMDAAVYGKVSERSQNLNDVRYYVEVTCVRPTAVAGERTKPIFTGPSHLSPGLRQAGTLGTNQSQPRPLARHVTTCG